MTGRHLKPSTVLVAALCLAASGAGAQTAQPQEALPKPTEMKLGDTLSGELSAMRSRHAKSKRGVFQLVSEPRRLPSPSGLCNLENGPETFQIVTATDAEAKQLKKLIGKKVSFKVKEVACAQEAGQMSEAIVTKWSVVGTP